MPVATTTTRLAFDVHRIRRDFPILSQQVYGKPLVYLDNAATTQKPRAVLDAVNDYYSTYNSNVHRGVHALSEKATAEYEASRDKMMKFVNARSRQEIVFTRGTTESINVVTQSYARTTLKPGDEVLITWMEHHSNIVPWQIVCEQTGAKLRVAPINDRGELILDEFKKLLSEQTKIVSVAHISNALGTVNPVKEITRLAHEAGAVVVIDGAQAAAHAAIDVQDLGCDFYALSGHKMFGPTGIGILYGREALLEKMPPWQGGGDMISSVTFEKTIYNELPYKFEAGTPHIEGGIVIGVAADYIKGLDFAAAMQHEHELLEYGTGRLAEIEGLKMIGTARQKAAVLSFIIEGHHPYDIAPILDRQGVAIRTGHHCAQPVMERYGVPATVRASLALYNTKEELDTLIEGLRKARKMITGEA